MPRVYNTRGDTGRWPAEIDALSTRVPVPARSRRTGRAEGAGGGRGPLAMETLLLEDHADPAGENGLDDLLGRSPVMQELFRQMRLLAPLDAPVLVDGEPGSGKELVVRSLHRLSSRAGEPLVCLRVPDISPALFASELLGHAEGAFAGALAAEEGAAASADGGTLFLDEIGELTPESRPLLLRFLHSHQVVPVGGGPPREVDVRLLCTASRDPAAPAGGLHPELALVLGAFTLRVPPLRERREDLSLLAEHFLRRFALQYAKRIDGIRPEAMQLLAAQRWEGNVRQLAEEMERAVVLTNAGDAVGPEVFSARLKTE